MTWAERAEHVLELRRILEFLGEERLCRTKHKSHAHTDAGRSEAEAVVKLLFEAQIKCLAI